MPEPIFIGAEKGIPRDLGFNVATIHPTNWIDVFDVVASLKRDRHKHLTAVLDTVDWLEPFIHHFVCERDSDRKTEMNPKGHKLESIEDYGYGKGYLVAEEEFRKLIRVLDELQNERGMHVVMLAHSQVKTFKNPAGPDFDRWEMKCHYRIAKVIEEWAENLLFGFFQVDASKISEDKERNKAAPDRARAKGVGGGVRLVGAQHSAMYDAKNRVGLPAEFELGEQIDGLIEALLGEKVESHGRRAQVREVRREEAWADRQRRVDGERTQRAARENAEADAPPPPDRRDANANIRDHATRPTQTEAAARQALDEHADRTREARTWTEPKAPPADERTRGPGSAAGMHGNGRPTNGAATKVDGGLLAQRLGEARRAASKKGQAYLDRVNGWVQKAGDVPERIQSIIAQVEKDLGISIPS